MNFRGSQLSIGGGIRRRLPSISDSLRKQSNIYQTTNDILLDPLCQPHPLHIGNHPDSPVDNVRQLIESTSNEPQQLFTELLELKTDPDDDDLSWRQFSRWIKYEQMVEGDGTRFSKPHITLLNIQSILQLRSCLRKGVVILDLKTESYSSLVDVLVQSWRERDDVNEETARTVRDVLNATKLHLVGNRLRKINVKSSNEDGRQQSLAITTTTVKLPKTDTTSVEDRLLKNLPNDAEAAIIFVGQLDALEKPIAAFVRIDPSAMMYPEVPQLPIPVRFVFVLLNPHENFNNETICIGRTMGALLADEVFRKVAYATLQPFTLSDAVEEFFSQIVAIPPGKCTTDARWEPHEESDQVCRSVGMLYATYEAFDETGEKEEESKKDLRRTGKFFGGLREDIKRKVPFYLSDFGDFFRGRLSQSLAAAIFLFFANVTSIITFGAVMERALHHQMAAIENLLCGGISGVIFALFSGQPLNILSATGPTLVFEKILFEYCIGNHWEFLPVRFWVGIWTAAFLIILVATDMSALVSLITRFTEEAFATLISVVFIIQAFQKLLEISHDAPIIADPREVYESPCVCHLNETMPFTNITIRMKLRDISADECEERGGFAIGLQCRFKPDVYMLSVLLTFGTFALAYLIQIFRHSPFLSSKVRNCIADFGVFIAIVSMTAFSHFTRLDVPSLHVPNQFRPTLHRNWIIDPMSVDSWWVAAIACLPAIFYTILIVMDQQITAVIVNRADNKLKKGHGYHLDLLIIAVLIIFCSFLGIPFYVAATVLSVMHVDSLRVQSECSAPGEKAIFLGVKEQRITGIVAHIAIGMAVFLTPVIKLVPLPVLIGIFLYMGVVSLFGQQFVQRVALLFMPIKHQPDHTWLRIVRMKRVHLFTAIQMLSIVCLFAVKYTRQISMMFPLMLVFMVLIRMFILEKIFTRQELIALDDIVPSFRSVIKPSALSSTKFKEDGEVGSVELENRPFTMTNDDDATAVVDKNNSGVGHE